jgi:hypothetical protein
MFGVPGTLWLLMASRWQETTAPLEPSATSTVQEEELETRIG